MADAIEHLQTLQTNGLAELQACSDEPTLRVWNTKYFGDKGLVKAALAGIGEVAKDQRATFGKEANRMKVALETVYETALAAAKEAALLAGLSSNPLDVTLPGRAKTRGRLHPATLILRQIYAIFADMGFQVYRTRESKLTSGTSNS